MPWVLYSLCGAALAAALYYRYAHVPQKLAQEVLSNLAAGRDGVGETHERGRSDFSLDDPCAQLGLFSEAERRRLARARVIVPLGCGAAALALHLAAAPWAVAGHVVFALGGVSLGYLLQKRGERRKKEEYQRTIEFYLPMIMERLVMAAQAGLDILPAIRAIIEADGAVDENSRRAKLRERGYDPVSRLLRYAYRLTESGFSFDQSLSYVAQRVASTALRHAFIHLAVSHREGGELIGPLRELSDATQLYLQESVEEEIAKMPVRATMPLVITFAGLLVFFLASPLLQILDFVAKAKVG